MIFRQLNITLNSPTHPDSAKANAAGWTISTASNGESQRYSLSCTNQGMQDLRLSAAGAAGIRHGLATLGQVLEDLWTHLVLPLQERHAILKGLLSPAIVLSALLEVVGVEEGKQLYALPTNDWVFISDCPKALATVQVDPNKLLRGLNKQYDVALRFEFKNLPGEHGKKLLALLDEKLGGALREVASEETMELLGTAAYALEQATLGWSEHNAE